MSYSPYSAPNTEPIDAEALLLQLRRKQGTWVEWGQACNQLQKAGYQPDRIFEETGFEPVQQNQVMVAAQVYTSLIKGDIKENVRSHFNQKSSDILYEFRILTQPQRVAAAEFSLEQNLDADQAHELAKAIKDFSRNSSPTEGFSQHPGDIMAHQCWKSAREHKDIQERSRLIAKGLRYAQSGTARQHLEHLLTDFTVVPQKSAPRLPVYRLESADESPRVIPVVGQFPLSFDDWKAVPFIEPLDPFGVVRSQGTSAFVAVPGWPVIRGMDDPVALLANSEQLPQSLSKNSEPVLILVDRQERQWQSDRYFLVNIGGKLELQWSDTEPEHPLLAQVVLVMRPHHILDPEFTKQLWQVEE
ncbi:hypothetical protein PJF56_11030 [Roseofilum sp. BLCC_M91]|uniref:RuBisCO accumulation factor 1 n=1 Tax=Roseofilum halophilum BLCC-M91 TaxID=3022259 RepID=A0ABT7BJN7_9CYAN|nr:RuBisCO accumulation factor 1 [Roseofilum halophilum]MDJ1179399.1 hypothetical protein [Roseofilum halophilum BLCC-M91]